jgi:hypothetical protein
MEELRIKTIDTGYARPGRLMMYDTDVNHCKVAGAGETAVLGWLYPKSTHDDDTDFTTEDVVDLAHGPGVVFWGYATTGQTIVKGVLLYPAAHGALKTTATGSERAVAQAEKSVTTTTLAEQALLVRSLV